MISSSVGQGGPYAYLSSTHFANDHYKDLDNGRLFGLRENIIHPKCRSTAEWEFVVQGVLKNIIYEADWKDNILNSATPMTFLCPALNEMDEYIEQNGGFSNTSFIDSLIRRHIINEYFPIQKVDEETTVKNLLGEDLVFTKQDGQYYLNDSINILFSGEYLKLASILIDTFLVESIVSTTESINLKDLDIYPNPSDDVFSISYTIDKNADVNISIYNEIGEMISVHSFPNQISGEHNFLINDDLPKGFHFVKIQIGEELLTKKIVKL